MPLCCCAMGTIGRKSKRAFFKLASMNHVFKNTAGRRRILTKDDQQHLLVVFHNVSDRRFSAQPHRFSSAQTADQLCWLMRLPVILDETVFSFPAESIRFYFFFRAVSKQKAHSIIDLPPCLTMGFMCFSITIHLSFFFFLSY